MVQGSPWMKYILTICLAVFALAPCKVKDVWLSASSTTSPFHKFKTTTSSASCVYHQENRVGQSDVNQGQKSQQHFFFSTEKREYAIDTYVSAIDVVRFAHAGNSPPKYILYQRLKVDIA